jgi:hypothetical protein
VSRQRLRHRFAPVLEEIAKRSSITERFIDKDFYRIYIATLWANLVLDPSEIDLEEEDLEPAHDYLNGEIAKVLGDGASITECFRFINSKAGDDALSRCQVSQSHRDLLHYFCSMILDPEGHKRWRDEIKQKTKR